MFPNKNKLHCLNDLQSAVIRNRTFLIPVDGCFYSKTLVVECVRLASTRIEFVGVLVIFYWQ